MVIPGSGRLCNESDVDDYRNWMTMVKDRVQEMIKKKMTLAAGEGRAADARVRRRVRDAGLDHRPVRRGGVPLAQPVRNAGAARNTVGRASTNGGLRRYQEDVT